MNQDQMNKINLNILKNNNILILNEDELTKSFGIQYIDLFALADVISGKTGYSIVSEIIVNNLNFLYTERGKFREQEILMKALEENSNSKKINIEEIYKLNPILFEKANNLLKNQKKLNSVEDGAKKISKILLDEI